MNTDAPLLVIRFSALGDVAMTVPVLRTLVSEYPTVQVCMVSNQSYAPLFEGIERVRFFGVDLQGRHRGLLGIYRLFTDLKKMGPYRGVADLHSVLRSVLLSSLWTGTGLPIAHLQKGRGQKRKLTRRYHKKRLALPSSFDRMASVFASLNFPIQGLPFSAPSIFTRKTHRSELFRIGVAPFAKHPEKAYPLSLMKELIALLASRGDLSIQLFGGGASETGLLQQWEKEFPGVMSMAGRFSLREELVQISKLDAMISMDSANMHLASLSGIPVLSVWGPTHPFAGFMGWRQPIELAVQVDLACRPCSVFGNKRCYRGDHACMRQIEPKTIVARLDHLLELLR